MADTVIEKENYTDLLKELVSNLPKKISLNTVASRVKKRLSNMTPEEALGYLNSVLTENLTALLFEDIDNTEEKMASIDRNLKEALLNTLDDDDLDTAIFLLGELEYFEDDLIENMDDSSAFEEDDSEYEDTNGMDSNEAVSVDETEEMVDHAESIFERLPAIEKRPYASDLGTSWLRVTMDGAYYNPNWIRYCRLHRAKRITELSWDFPMLPHEDALEVLNIIKKETGYTPKWYYLVDNRGVDVETDVFGRPSIA